MYQRKGRPYSWVPNGSSGTWWFFAATKNLQSHNVISHSFKFVELRGNFLNVLNDNNSIIQ